MPGGLCFVCQTCPKNAKVRTCCMMLPHLHLQAGQQAKLMSCVKFHSVSRGNERGLAPTAEENSATQEYAGSRTLPYMHVVESEACPVRSC